MKSPTSRRRVAHSCALLDPSNPYSQLLDRLSAALPALEALAGRVTETTVDARASPSPAGAVPLRRRGLMPLPDLSNLPTIYDDRVQLVTIPIRRIPGLVTDEPITVRDFDQAQELIRALSIELELDHDQEHFIILMSDNVGRIYGFKHIGSGSRYNIVVDVGVVYRSALLLGAAGILAMHNHPSGNLDISEEDEVLTIHLQVAANIMGIQLLDHIIHAPDGRCRSIRAEYPKIWSK